MIVKTKRDRLRSLFYLRNVNRFLIINRLLMASPFFTQFIQRLNSKMLAMTLTFSLVACQAGYQPPNAFLSIHLATSCKTTLLAFHEQMQQEGVLDQSTPALPAFPLLHVNRFLESLTQTINSEAEANEWYAMTAELGSYVRAVQNENLAQPWDDQALAQLNECADSFIKDPEYQDLRMEIVSTTAITPVIGDHYNQLQKWIGFFPLLRPFLLQRIYNLHEDEQRWFSDTENFPLSTSYAPAQNLPLASAIEIKQWLGKAYTKSTLGIPYLDAKALDALFALHAPKLIIEHRDNNDLIGSPEWQGKNIVINNKLPSTYILPSFARISGRNILQLNYVFWFSERKATNLIDLYSGAIDSLIWRVNLDEDGQVFLYDSIHSCGCYHKYFRVADDLLVKTTPLSNEPANIFDVTKIDPMKGINLTLSANEHYLVGMENSRDTPSTQTDIPYSIQSYGLLSSLPFGTGNRSMFSANGIIEGTERLERFTLWPTGVASVGSMRGWGTHATGFIEQQHFDDAELLDNYFELQ
jgi:hypothetical protein